MAKISEGFKGERLIRLPPFIVEGLKKEILSKELYVSDLGYYPQAKYHFFERTAREARNYVLIYCVEGQGWFSLKNQKHIVKRFQFFILPKDQAHSYGSDAEQAWTIYWLHFDGIYASFFAEGFDRPTDISPDINSRIEERLNLFDEIFSTLSKGYNRNHLNYATIILFHFLGSMKFLGEYRQITKAPKKDQETMEAVIHYMRENLERKLSLAELAEYAGLSSSRFSILFQKKTGCPPLTYLNQLKIQKACHYLDSTDMKVNQISSKFGFVDAFYFSRVFTKIMGLSPTDYRKRKKTSLPVLSVN